MMVMQRKSIVELQVKNIQPASLIYCMHLQRLTDNCRMCSDRLSARNNI